MKNIPIASRKEYIVELTHSTREFVNNSRWRVLHYLNPSKKQGNKQTYGLKSTKRCEPVPELQELEEKLYDMVKNIKFKEVSNRFQDKLNEDISKIETEPKVFMKADKTTNYYKVEVKKSEEMVERLFGCRSTKKQLIEQR